MPRSVPLILSLLVLVLLPALIFGWLQGGESFLNFNPDSSAPRELTPATPLSPLILSLIMLVGIVFGAANAEIGSLRQVEFRAVLRNLWRRPSLWQSILAAPIVFSGVYAAAGSTAVDPIVGSLFAFQNGFFCETILREREKKPAAIS